jgi:large subunit ribosomal protein L3
MANGILGKKIGMSQIFSDNGNITPVTLIEAGPCKLTAIRDKSLQLAFGQIKEKQLTKAKAGLFKKLNITPAYLMREVPKDSQEYQLGQEIKVDIFKAGDFIDVTGVSIGKGFQGGMKRWHWKGGPRTRGSTSHRRVGSMGSSSSPGRVWKGHHLPGHMGSRRITTQNLKIVKIDLENNLLLVKGAVPGHKNSYLIIKRAKKKSA